MKAHENITTAASAGKPLARLHYRISSWFKNVLLGDHAMKVTIGFFAIMLFVLAKVFGPGA